MIHLNRAIAVFAVLYALWAIDQFYVHPTYGRGLKALMAVLSAGRSFA